MDYYHESNREKYIDLWFDINLCDKFYTGDLIRPTDIFQTVTVDISFEKAIKDFKAVLDAWEICKLGSDYSGVYTQWHPYHGIKNKTVTRYCFIFGNLLIE